MPCLFRMTKTEWGISIKNGDHQDVCEREIGYFERGKKRMRHADFIKRGLFIGSGVLAAGFCAPVSQFPVSQYSIDRARLL